MGNFLKTKFNRIKNSFKNNSNRAFGKIGLFLIFGIIVWNFNFVIHIDNVENNLSISFLSKVNAAGGLGTYWNTAKETLYNVLPAARVGSWIGGATGDMASTGLLWVFNWLLYGILHLISNLLIVSGALLDSALDPALFDKVRDENLYKIWAFVRDALNIFFVLLLLFSAFATIFQVEKYHLRKMIIMLVVMALLVNFSFPISRFIIDFSNSAMYFLVDQLHVASGTTSGYFSKSALIADITGYGKLQNSDISGDKETTTLLLGLIVYTFALFITMFSIAVNLVIRIIAFMILMVLSPVGFAFAFFPGTKSIADDWWSALFKYAFMGPVMVFFLLMAVVVFKSGVKITGSEKFIVGNVVNFIFVVSFLWMALVASNKFGGVASATAMSIAKSTGGKIKSYGQKAAWGTAGLAVTGVGRGADALTGHKISGGIGGLKSKWDSWGENYKTKSNTRKTEAAAYLGVNGANEKLVRENMKKMKEEGISDADLHTKETSGTNAERMAVALFRAENNRFDNNPALAQAQYNNAMNAVRGHQVYENQFLSGARKQNMDLVINENITHSGAITPAAIQNVIRGELQRLNPDQWKDQNIQRMLHGTTPNRGYIITEGAHVISGYSTQAQDNVVRNMGGQKYAQGQTSGLW